MTGLLQTFVFAAVGLLLTYAGVAKLIQIRQFSGQLEKFAFLPTRTVPYLSAIVPVTEIAIGAALIAGFHVEKTVPLCLGLLSLFSVWILWGLARGRRMSCFCLGETEGTMDWRTLVRNLFLIMIVLLAFLVKPLASPELPARIVTYLSGATACGVFIIGWQLWLLYGEARKFV